MKDYLYEDGNGRWAVDCVSAIESMPRWLNERARANGCMSVQELLESIPGGGWTHYDDVWLDEIEKDEGR